jgi:hypothetical protein
VRLIQVPKHRLRSLNVAVRGGIHEMTHRTVDRLGLVGQRLGDNTSRAEPLQLQHSPAARLTAGQPARECPRHCTRRLRKLGGDLQPTESRVTALRRMV